MTDHSSGGNLGDVQGDTKMDGSGTRAGAEVDEGIPLFTDVQEARWSSAQRWVTVAANPVFTVGWDDQASFRSNPTLVGCKVSRKEGTYTVALGETDPTLPKDYPRTLPESEVQLLQTWVATLKKSQAKATLGAEDINLEETDEANKSVRMILMMLKR